MTVDRKVKALKKILNSAGLCAQALIDAAKEENPRFFDESVKMFVVGKERLAYFMSDEGRMFLERMADLTNASFAVRYAATADYRQVHGERFRSVYEAYYGRDANQ